MGVSMVSEPFYGYVEKSESLDVEERPGGQRSYKDLAASFKASMRV